MFHRAVLGQGIASTLIDIFGRLESLLDRDATFSAATSHQDATAGPPSPKRSELLGPNCRDLRGRIPGSMLRINPFTALRPQPNRAAQVASVPYDVVDTAEARELAKGNPLSFLHVVRSEIDLPEGTDPYDDAVYAKGRENLQKLIDEEILVQEDKPVMYIYRQVMNHRPQVGLVCCCHIDDYANDIIKKHEKTRKDKEDDRTRHVLRMDANAEPVFLTYHDQPQIDALMKADMNDRPLFHFNAPDGVTHTVWTVENPEAYVSAFRNVEASYIADGHHRSASAARAGAELRAKNPHHTGSEEYNWFLSVLFPASQLQILPYNRVVNDLAGLSQQAFLDRLSEISVVHSCESETHIPHEPGTVCFYLGGELRGWRKITFDPDTIDYADPIASLDVALLQSRVLEPILGIGDLRTDKRIDFVGGNRGVKELEDRVNSGRAAVAFSMYPTTIEQLLAVADAGKIMPPKSTWFEPKLRSGLFVHTLDSQSVSKNVLR